jgi:hypothetical protein
MVAITQVGPEPRVVSGVIAVVVSVVGMTGSGARTYYIPFFEPGQRMPKAGETCAISWRPWPGFSAVADRGTVKRGPWVSGFRCGSRSWSSS